MEFGKTDRFQEVDFSLPKESESNFRDWGADKLKIYIGAPVFNHSKLLKKISSEKRSHTPLEVYSKFFSCIELNSSFYTIPKVEQVKNWKKQAQGDFKFVPKFVKTVSHFGVGFSKLSEVISEYLSSIVHFKEMLGASFIQFPEDFGENYAPELKSFLKRIPERIPLTIELRNKKLLDIKFSNPKVILDVAGRRELLKLELSHDWVMIRFVGNSLDKTDYERLDDWIDLLKQWNDRGMREVFFILHQPDESQCYDLALYLKEKLGDLVIGCDPIKKKQMSLI